MTHPRNAADDYQLDGSFMHKSGQLLRHALRTEPWRFGLAIGFAGDSARSGGSGSTE